MKQISTIISVIALVVAGAVYFVQNREIGQLKKRLEGAKPAGVASTGTNFKIAYFDLDTLQEKYEFMKDVKNQAIDKENQMNQDLASRDRKNQQQIAAWRQRGNTMTQAEAEEANRQLQVMQQDFADHKQELEQNFYKFQESKRDSIRSQIENFIKEYNKDKNFAYIIAYDHANSFIYNKDTIYNITNDLVAGLNANYASYKKSK
ncbi:MAG TPA: OmpH family outer membrane protein [Puia sp.]|jgi:outer membrane protein|nr:OmpH family outer membrane protein [Puia sp.]